MENKGAVGGQGKSKGTETETKGHGFKSRGNPTLRWLFLSLTEAPHLEGHRLRLISWSCSSASDSTPQRLPVSNCGEGNPPQLSLREARGREAAGRPASLAPPLAWSVVCSVSKTSVLERLERFGSIASATPPSWESSEILLPEATLSELTL